MRELIAGAILLGAGGFGFLTWVLAANGVSATPGGALGFVIVAVLLSLGIGVVWHARHRQERGVQDSDARLRTIIDSAVDGIITIDSRGRVESFNPGAERLFGYQASDVIGRNVSMLMPSPDRDQHDGYLARYLKTGDAKIIGIGREVTGLKRDGSTFPLYLSVGEMSISGERRFTGIIHDLTTRMRIEKQLREHSGLAMLGEMAAVVAHEVKNPLAGIRGAIQVVGSRLEEGSKDALMVKEVISRIDALNELMKDLLLFARPPQPRTMPVDLRQLVELTVALVRADPTLQGLRVEIEGSCTRVDADAELLKIVFLNLILNAAQAMGGAGVVRVSFTTHGERCEVAFADAGPGMPAEVLAKIFVPFFTTKTRGTGLGLPTAKRIIEAHRGSIDVVCPPTGGTTVKIQLPGSVV